MPVFELKAHVDLSPGARLRYDCPPMSTESWKADTFFKQHKGKIARFVGCVTEYIGPGDRLGRSPGLYVNPKGLRVVFEGETEVHALNYAHFTVLEPDAARIVFTSADLQKQRVGDLPEAIRFRVLDTVSLTSDLLRVSRRVKGVEVNRETGAVTYCVYATRQERENFDREQKVALQHGRGRGLVASLPMPIEQESHPSADLLLVQLGPLSLIEAGERAYEAIEAALDDPQSALAFWDKYGRGSKVESRPKGLGAAIAMLQAGTGALIDDHDHVIYEGNRPVIDVYDVAPCMEPYRDRIVELSVSYWNDRRFKLEKHSA